MNLLGRNKSLFLSSLNTDGSPHSSYAPFAIKDDALLILISGLAAHTQNLLRSPQISALIADDESQCEEIFARLRVTYDLQVNVIESHSSEWEESVGILEDRLGERVRQISQLGDFVLFKLIPIKGRFVKGFGKAYEVLGGTLAGQEVVHVSPKMLSQGVQL